MTDSLTLQALDHLFGHIPDEKAGEKWTVFEDKMIVVHPDRPPRVYPAGCRGNFYELALQP